MIDERKQDHLDICIKENVEVGDSGFASVKLAYKPLPELDFNSISTQVKFLGKKLEFPLVINAMTGGTEGSRRINRDIAEVAQEYGIGMGVGSQRAAIEDPKLEDTFTVKESAPKLPLLIANLGAVQLNYGYGIKECKKAVEMIKADALALHINPLQEVVQPEGDTNFAGLIKKINAVSSKLKTPVIAKCVGEGLTSEIARKLKVNAFDVAGVGGTSWSLVESYRSAAMNRRVGERFAGFGVSTVDSIKDCIKLKKPLIGSGGIRNGLDAVKAIALGANLAGIALPVLKAWNISSRDGIREYLDEFIKEFKIGLFMTGSKNVKELKGKVLE